MHISLSFKVDVGVSVGFDINVGVGMEFLAYRMAASIVVRRSHFQNAISLQPAGRSQLNFICSMSFVEDCLQMHSRKIASELWLQWQLIGPIDLLWEMLVNSVAPLFFVGSS